MTKLLWYEKFLKEKKEKNKKRLSLDRLIDMYFMRLSDKLCRLFVYDGLPFPQHELEFRAIMTGFAGVVNDPKRGVMTAWGSMSGTTQYSDYFNKFTYSAPTAKGGTLSIGESAVILRNTSLAESMYDYIFRFAELFAHNDISLKIALINSRYQDIIKTKSPEKKETILDWYDGLYEGKQLAIIDESPMSEFLDTDGSISAMELTRTGEIDFTRFTELENELMRMFYREIGVRWNKDKKANLVSGEVEQDNMLLRFNIADMLKCRQLFCEEFNKVFDGNLSVKLTIPLVELDGGETNENDL